MSAACRERSLPLRAAWLQLPVTRTAHHSEDVTYKQVTGYIQCITLNHDPGLNPVDVEVFWTGYWDDNLPDTGPDTGYPLKPDYHTIPYCTLYYDDIAFSILQYHNVQYSTI